MRRRLRRRRRSFEWDGGRRRSFEWDNTAAGRGEESVTACIGRLSKRKESFKNQRINQGFIRASGSPWCFCFCTRVLPLHTSAAPFPRSHTYCTNVNAYSPSVSQALCQSAGGPAPLSAPCFAASACAACCRSSRAVCWLWWTISHRSIQGPAITGSKSSSSLPAPVVSSPLPSASE